MNGLPELNDLIVLVPGILGSVLEKKVENKWETVWDTSTSVLLDVLNRGKGIRSLELKNPEADDAVRATGLLQGATLIPGFFKIDGYADIKRYITSQFRYASAESPHDPAGFQEFPYDWRRDNRQTAKLLAAFIAERLKAWREFRENPKARVILLGHSMGGLVASLYLAVEGGWKDCRALITIGTPFRGSLRAVNYLANGYRVYGMNLNAPLRSFPSVYQLLPDYQVVRGEKTDSCLDKVMFAEVVRTAIRDEYNAHHRVKLSAAEPEEDHLSDLVSKGLSLPLEIREALENLKHSKNPPYSVVCYVGTGQPTFQSVQVSDKIWGVSAAVLPRGVDVGYGDGDGVVPHFSAIHDSARDDAARLHSFAACHAGLPSNLALLMDLRGVLRQFQVGEYRKVGFAPPLGTELQLEGLKDCYEIGEIVGFRARILGGSAGIQMKARFLFEGQEKPIQLQMRRSGECYELELKDIPKGVHHITILPADPAQIFPQPVTDVFAVLPRPHIDEA